jgi:hypothetical protein
MFLKHMREEEKKANRVRWAAGQLRDAQEAASVPPGATIVACAAYLCECASFAKHPTYGDALKSGYKLHASALEAALTDAVALQWIAQTSKGSAYWLEAGKRDDCPLYLLAKMHPKFARK